MLLILGLGYLAWGVVLVFVDYNAGIVPSQSVSSEALTDLLVNALIGAVMLGCYAWAKRDPVSAMTVALGVWLPAQVASGFLSPQVFVTAFLSATGVVRLGVKLFVLVPLLLGLNAALRARSLERKLASAPRPPPSRLS